MSPPTVHCRATLPLIDCSGLNGDAAGPSSSKSAENVAASVASGSRDECSCPPAAASSSSPSSYYNASSNHHHPQHNNNNNNYYDRREMELDLDEDLVLLPRSNGREANNNHNCHRHGNGNKQQQQQQQHGNYRQNHLYGEEANSNNHRHNQHHQQQQQNHNDVAAGGAGGGGGASNGSPRRHSMDQLRRLLNEIGGQSNYYNNSSSGGPTPFPVAGASSSSNHHQSGGVGSSSGSGSRHRSLSDSSAHREGGDEDASAVARSGKKERGEAHHRHSHGQPDILSNTPPVPPKRSHRRRHTPPRPISNGLPPTPKVHMGACFSKIFNGCPLRIYCTASWIHPDTRDQHLLLGAEEGIFYLNMNELHDAAIEKVFPRRTTWLYVIKDVLMSASGKSSQLYRHDLVAMHSRQSTHRFSLHMNKFPEKLVPRKFALNTRVPDTKGTVQCCVTRNPYNGYKYLCGAQATGTFLMQWYDPLNKFMLLKQCDWPQGSPGYGTGYTPVFEMIIAPELEYPLVCTAVRRSSGGSGLKLDLINMNSGASWLHADELEMDGTATMVPRREPMPVVKVHQVSRGAMEREGREESFNCIELFFGC